MAAPSAGEKLSPKIVGGGSGEDDIELLKVQDFTRLKEPRLPQSILSDLNRLSSETLNRSWVLLSSLLTEQNYRWGDLAINVTFVDPSTGIDSIVFGGTNQRKATTSEV